MKSNVFNELYFLTSRIVQLRTHYEQQLKNNTEILQKNNSQLQDLLKER